MHTRVPLTVESTLAKAQRSGGGQRRSPVPRTEILRSMGVVFRVSRFSGGPSVRRGFRDKGGRWVFYLKLGLSFGSTVLGV